MYRIIFKGSRDSTRKMGLEEGSGGTQALSWVLKETVMPEKLYYNFKQKQTNLFD